MFFLEYPSDLLVIVSLVVKSKQNKEEGKEGYIAKVCDASKSQRKRMQAGK